MATYTDVLPVLNTTTGRFHTIASGDTVTEFGTWDYTGTLGTGVSALAQFNGIDHTSRFVLTEEFAHIPQINASVGNANANKNFELIGAGPVTDAQATLATTGGVLLTTVDLAANNQTILRSHTAGGGGLQSAWNDTQWSTADQVILKANIRTTAAVTTSLIAVGMKITCDNFTAAADANQVYLLFDSSGAITGSATDFAVIASAAAVVPTSPAVTIALNTNYRVVFTVAATTRICRVFINGVLVATTADLGAGITTLKPFAGVQQLAGIGNARSMVVQRMSLSKIYT
jgi:hypothetical protein